MTVLGLTNAGFRVTSCTDGREGLDRLRRDPFDLAVLDVMLPRLDGFEIMREVRKGSRIPIVMLTARADATDVIVGLELGADDYVTKPFDMPVLVAGCRAVLRRAAAEPAEPTLRVGQLEVDVAGYSARKDGHDLALTATEFRLLVELVRRPGQVLTREVLLSRVWDYETPAIRGSWMSPSNDCAPRSRTPRPARRRSRRCAASVTGSSGADAA